MPKPKASSASLAAVQKVFDLPQPPRRIEVYDNSHIMGTNMVGGMVVAGPEGYEKKKTSTASSTSRTPTSNRAMTTA